MDEHTKQDRVTRATALAFKQEQRPEQVEKSETGAKVLVQASGALARQITALARQHNVLVLQDFVLSERLTTVPVGSRIPDTVFTVLAVMLDFLQQEDGRKPDKA